MRTPHNGIDLTQFLYVYFICLMLFIFILYIINIDKTFNKLKYKNNTNTHRKLIEKKFECNWIEA